MFLVVIVRGAESGREERNVDYNLPYTHSENANLIF